MANAKTSRSADTAARPRPFSRRLFWLGFGVPLAAFTGWHLYRYTGSVQLQRATERVADVLPEDLDTERVPMVEFPIPEERALPSEPLRKADPARRDAVLEAFDQSWNAYATNAWGDDEYHPLSRSGSNLLGPRENKVGYTIVDTLDSLILMHRADAYAKARDWIRDELHWDVDGRLNVFETTIRLLGGLLSASALMKNPPPGALPASVVDAELFLAKAEALGQRLLPAFDTPSGIPKREVNLRTGESFFDTDNQNASSLAEATTIQLEFKYLAHLTGNKKFWDVAERPMYHARIASEKPNAGILPIFMQPQTGQFFLAEIRLGSRGDSYYEYLVKQYLQTNRTEHVYRAMYEHAFDWIKTSLLEHGRRTEPPLLFTVELFPRGVSVDDFEWTRLQKQDHLVCFLGGAMMLGAAASSGPIVPPIASPRKSAAEIEDWDVGYEITRTCVYTYAETATGLASEIVLFRDPVDSFEGTREFVIKRRKPQYEGEQVEPLIDARNILRPETVESLYVGFQLTGDPIYREWGWHIFESFRTHCQVDGGAGGYAGIDDVDAANPKLIDRMETFWLSETLKYLYLLFSDRDTLQPTEWVLNTEAHPLPVFTPTFPTSLT